MNIAILGGGTAGWLTALLVQQFYPNEKITLIESSKMGILGAGEGTTPNFISILNTLNIRLSDFISECDATIKTGIKFTNWNGDGTSYFHDFASNEGLDYALGQYKPLKDMVMHALIARDIPLDSINFPGKLGAENKVPFSYVNNVNGFFNKEEPLYNLASHGTYALHFNARKVAAFLKKIAIQRGINYIDDIFVHATNDDKNNIVRLNLESRAVDCDFVFDCTGFARLLIGKHYNTEWISYKEHLPLDTALPFFIPHNNKDLPPYTESIAMKYGWVWKIPVKDRYGCGYVFDSSLITKEQALKEVEDYFGHSVESPTMFKFNAGGYRRTLVNNCMAVGLAQSFIEPLEATSIWVFCINLLNFLRKDGIKTRSNVFIEEFNGSCNNYNLEVVEFLQAHYLTQRGDSEFWNTFRTRTRMPQGLEKKIYSWNINPPTSFDRTCLNNMPLFTLYSWMTIMDGAKIFNRESFNNHCINLSLYQRIGNMVEALQQNQHNVKNTCIDHVEFLNYVQGK